LINLQKGDIIFTLYCTAMSSRSDSGPTFKEDLQVVIRQELQKFKEELLGELQKVQQNESDVTAESAKGLDTSLGFTEGLMIGGLIAWFTFRSWK
jgi:hypothetical protein